MNGIPSLNEKCTGALLASAVGDALGWPYESRARNSTYSVPSNGIVFVDWTRRAGGQYWSHEETIHAGEYSDDTQMIIAVSRSILSDNWKYNFAIKELPFWLEYERGGGSALKKAAIAYRGKKYPWDGNGASYYFNAGGNGTVMRILPHVIAHAHSECMDQLMHDVIIDSMITHGHPRAILGATCYAFSLYYIMKKKTILQFGELIDRVIEGASIWGKYRPEIFPSQWATLPQNILPYNYKVTWINCVEGIVKDLNSVKDSLKKGLLVNDKAVLSALKCFDKESGAGDVAILASLYLASKYANNPVLGIKTAAYTRGIDTDTIASITGGLLGMLCGTSWIPTEWRAIQDYPYLCSISDLILSNNKQGLSADTSEEFTAAPQLHNSPIGKLRLLDKKNLASGKSGLVTISKWETHYGQTIYTKKFQRVKLDDRVNTPYDERGLSVPTTSTIESKHALVFDQSIIKDILSSPALSRITLKKVLQIAEIIINNDKSDKQIANSLNVNEDVIKLVRHQIK